jgi:hypothetical protein
VIGDEHLVFAMAMPAWGIAIAEPLSYRSPHD